MTTGTKREAIEPQSVTQAERIAEELMNFAAWYSTQSPFGWAAPICGTIQDAARILRGEPERKPDDGKAPGVLS